MIFIFQNYDIEEREEREDNGSGNAAENGGDAGLIDDINTAANGENLYENVPPKPFTPTVRLSYMDEDEEEEVLEHEQRVVQAVVEERGAAGGADVVPTDKDPRPSMTPGTFTSQAHVAVGQTPPPTPRS